MFNKIMLNLGESKEEVRKIIGEIVREVMVAQMSDRLTAIWDRIEHLERILSNSQNNFGKEIRKSLDGNNELQKELEQIKFRLNYLFNQCNVKYDADALDMGKQ